MEQSLALAKAAQTGDIEALYTLLRQNPYLLEDIDKIPFVDTPLHTAASAGSTHFAIEIMGLKPSFAKKLNPDGYSPIDLAMASGQTQIIKQLIHHDPELIRVKSKERFTPLHYVAKVDDADLLAEFLVSCPKSIEDLTVRGETAVHVAVRNGNMRAFKVLLGWLSEAGLEQSLNRQDDKGDTVLHIATSTDNLDAVNLIMKTRKIDGYKKNVEGLTALDIAGRLRSTEANGSIAKMLSGAFTKRYSVSNKNLADKFIFISEASFWRQRLIRFVARGNNPLSDATREALLVVMVLIATATYQAILTPPPLFTRKKDEANNLKSFCQILVFLVPNLLTFQVSIWSMCIAFATDGVGFLVAVSLMYLVFCYLEVMLSYFPLHGPVALVVASCSWCLALIVIRMCHPTARKVLGRG